MSTPQNEVNQELFRRVNALEQVYNETNGYLRGGQGAVRVAVTAICELELEKGGAHPNSPNIWHWVI